MDIRRKLAVTLAAMALAGQLGATLPAVAASLAELETMESMLASDDLAGLASYIEQNPTLLETDTPLASLLMDFMLTYRGSLRLSAFPPMTVADMKVTLAEAVRAEIY